MKKHIYFLLVLLSVPAMGAPVCQDMDRRGYDAVMALPGVTYFESDCKFPGKYRDHLIHNVCWEDSVIEHDNGRVQKFRRVTCP
jgi:hypothetical protein